MRAFRCLVTGSRTWDDEATVNKALDAVAFGAADSGFDLMVVVHGACPQGGDAIADAWVRAWPVHDLTVTADRKPANWKRYGDAAGRFRNEHMVRLGADLCLAFLAPCASPKCKRPKPHDSHGATHCAELAGEAGIPLRVFHYGQPGVFALGLSEAVDG